MKSTPIWMLALLVALIAGALLVAEILSSDESPEAGPGISPKMGPVEGDRQVSEGSTEGAITTAPVPSGNSERPPTEAQRAVTKPFGGPRDMTIRGRVSDAGGQAIDGARVELYENVSRNLGLALAGALRAQATTESDGHYAIEAMMGTGSRFLMHVTHETHAHRWVRAIDPLQPATLIQDVMLADGQAISGTVRSGSGGPMGAVPVILRDLTAPARAGNAIIERTVLTGEDGVFRFEAASTGRKTIRVKVPGFCTAIRTPVRVQIGRDLTRMDFVLGRGEVISGRVVESGTTKGVSGARISLQAIATGAASPAPPKEETLSAADGSFSLSDVRAGTYVVRATADGYGQSVAANARAPAADVLLTLRTQATVRGRVIDGSGEPLSRCSVVAGPTPDPGGMPWARRTSDLAEDGSFTLATVKPGEIYIFAIAPGLGAGRVGPLLLDKGQMLSGVEIVIEKGAVVAGRVLDDSGRPLAGASVVLNRKIVLPERKHAAQFSPGFITRKLMVGMHEGTTYSDGSFLLAAMESGEYSLSVTAAGDFARAQTKLFTLHAGAETTVADIRLEPGARIEGIVLDAQGLPDSAATVNVIPLDEEGEARSASTDDDGRFLIRGLSAGSFKVLVMLRKGSVDLEAIKRNSLGLARTVDLVRGGVERLELRAVR